MDPNDISTPRRTTRRRILTGALGAGAAWAAAQTPPATMPTAVSHDEPNVPNDGKYALVPLRKEALRVTAVQSIIRSPRDMKNPTRELKANLEHMLELIDAANGFPGPQDLVCFHEQPIMGWNDWSREEALRVAIEVPGPETEAIGRKAKQYGCYVTFGTYARDKDWPGHLLLNGVLIAPDGNVVANHWKTNNVRGFRPGWDIFTTSIYDVLDRYREMYGEDAVLPLARTDIGNISCSITPFQPDIMRAQALKGMEMALRSSSGGYLTADAEMISRYNAIYMIVCNNSISPQQPGFPEFSGSGDTAIYGPGGVVARAKSFNEEFVTSTLPMATFRRGRRVPEMPMAMLLPVYNKYRPRYNPNLQATEIPNNGREASKFFESKRNW